MVETINIYEVVGFPVLKGQFWHADKKPQHQMHGPLSGFGYCTTQKCAREFIKKLRKQKKIKRPEIQKVTVMVKL